MIPKDRFDWLVYLGAACGALSTRAMGGCGSQASLEEAEAMIHATVGN